MIPLQIGDKSYLQLLGKTKFKIKIIIKSFKKCRISNTLGWSEDSEIRKKIPTEFEDEIVGEEEHEEDNNEKEFDPFDDWTQ